ncbi:hypothetical protein EJB05_41939, partial [Eragrostis curvula]
MARQGMPDYRRELPGDEAAAAVLHGRQRQLFFDAGTVLMLWGWSALTVDVSAPGKQPAGASHAAHAFLGLLLWLVGVSFVALAPVALRFPRAARFGAAAADAVVDGFLLEST